MKTSEVDSLVPGNRDKFPFPQGSSTLQSYFPLVVSPSVRSKINCVCRRNLLSQQKLIITVSKVAMLMSPRRINFKIQTFPIKMGNASLNGVTVKTIEGLVSVETKTSKGL